MLAADGGEPRELLVAEAGQDRDLAQAVGGHRAPTARPPRYWCTSWTAIDPSPTADATRLIDWSRTSPATNTPGRLVSSEKGSRSSRQRWRPSIRWSAAPETMKPALVARHGVAEPVPSAAAPR